jgi:2'-deoxynucleoside 5'-phosphate N-hydrolase
MNIYFSCSITGGRKDQPVYQFLVDAMLEDGHTVPTAHLSDANIHILENKATPEDVYRRDVEWVRNCDVLVAEVSTPSHGVGYEIALAESLGKPVFCCYESSRRISKMISGNPSSTFKVQAYQSPDEAIRNMRKFLKDMQDV